MKNKLKEQFRKKFEAKLASSLVGETCCAGTLEAMWQWIDKHITKKENKQGNPFTKGTPHYEVYKGLFGDKMQEIIDKLAK